jgi:hypothetical protein
MKVLAVVAATLAPFVALFVYFALAGDGLRALQEGGLWSFLVLGCTVVVGMTAPALVAFVPGPRPMWAGVAALPLLLGVVGAWRGLAMVTAAIGAVSAADRTILGAMGTAEVGSLFALALLGGGACLLGVGLVLVVVERGLGGAALLAAGGGLMAWGVYWLALRTGLAGFASVSAADKSVLLAIALDQASFRSVFAAVVVVALLLVGVLAVLVRKQPMASTASTIGMVAVAGVSVLAAALMHGVAGAAVAMTVRALPPSLVPFSGAASGVPGLFIQAGNVEFIDGEDDVAVVAVGARGADIRRGIQELQKRDATVPAIAFVGPAPPHPILARGLRVPAVIAPLLANATTGVSLRIATRCPDDTRLCQDDGAPAANIVVIGKSRAAADLTVGGTRYFVRSTDAPLWPTTDDDAAPRAVVLAFDDDVDAAVFAAVAERLKGDADGGERDIAIAVDAPAVDLNAPR